MAIELLIADDQEVVRAGLYRLLEGTDIQIVADAANGEDALRLALKHRPHVALIDVRLPEGDGLEWLQRFRQELPDLRVVMFSGHHNPTYVARSVALGAAGYLAKNASRSQLIDAIDRAGRGEALWTRDELRRVSGGLAGPHIGKGARLPLTKRESEVLKQLAFGLTNKEIAQALGISYETVKEHVQHILKKLAVADRTQAAVWAVRNELV
jgi:DNA-binding NarL/FixJ family response regulator